MFHFQRATWTSHSQRKHPVRHEMNGKPMVVAEPESNDAFVINSAAKHHCAIYVY